jgi:hypothetical protein
VHAPKSANSWHVSHNPNSTGQTSVRHPAAPGRTGCLASWTPKPGTSLEWGARYCGRRILQLTSTWTARPSEAHILPRQSCMMFLDGSMQLVGGTPTDISFCAAATDWTQSGQHTCTDAHDDGDAAKQDCAEAQQPLQMHAAGHPTADLRGCQQSGQMPADAAPVERARQEHAQHERPRLQLTYAGGRRSSITMQLQSDTRANS